MAREGRCLVLDRRELPARLASTRYACFHLSDCINYPAQTARLRNAYSAEIFPVTGPMVADGARNTHEWNERKDTLLDAFDASGLTSL